MGYFKENLDKYYQVLIENNYKESAARTRKSALSKAYKIGNFSYSDSFDKTIRNDVLLKNFLIKIKEEVSSQKEFDKIKNAIYVYSTLFLNKPNIGKKKNSKIKNALKNYKKAICLFDEIGDFLTANIIGEYAEIIVCDKFNLKRYLANTRDYDAEFGNKKVQIKSRWNRRDKIESLEFGKISKNEADTIFIGVVFDKTLNIYDIIAMDHDGLTKYFADHKKNNIVTYNKSLDKDKYCVNYLNNICVDKSLFDKI